MIRHITAITLLLAPLALAACGSDRPAPTQVIVQPAAPAPAPVVQANPIIVPEAPPPPQGELVPPPPPPQGAGTAAWQPGHWRYTGVPGNAWSWVGGQYVQVPPGQSVWSPGRWVQQPSGGWIWAEGHWA